MSASYRHLFFDLDNTLWDFEANSTETLTELYARHRLNELGVPSAEFFIEKYRHRNQMMWEQYRLGKLTKETLRNDRFALTFWDMGLDAALAPPALADDYVRESPRKTRLFPGAAETLGYLHGRYRMHIITNGFDEVQHTKLQAAGIHHFFDAVIISEHTGYKKPDVNIFRYAMKHTQAVPGECLMIGDGLEIDVLGAQNAGWDSVYFNPGNHAHDRITTYEIRELPELRSFL
jgi:putative hydrolase of the HAD superfamily